MVLPGYYYAFLGLYEWLPKGPILKIPYPSLYGPVYTWHPVISDTPVTPPFYDWI